MATDKTTDVMDASDAILAQAGEAEAEADTPDTPDTPDTDTDTEPGGASTFREALTEALAGFNEEGARQVHVDRLAAIPRKHADTMAFMAIHHGRSGNAYNSLTEVSRVLFPNGTKLGTVVSTVKGYLDALRPRLEAGQPIVNWGTPKTENGKGTKASPAAMAARELTCGVISACRALESPTKAAKVGKRTAKCREAVKVLISEGTSLETIHLALDGAYGSDIVTNAVAYIESESE